MNTSCKLAARALVLALATIAAAPPEPVGPVVIAKTSGNALLVWQATQFVEQLHEKGINGEAAVAEIENGGIKLLVRRKGLLQNASTVSLKVLFARTAATNNKEYAPTSFAGYQQVMILEITKAALDGVASKRIDPKHLPEGVKIRAIDLPY